MIAQDSIALRLRTGMSMLIMSVLTSVCICETFTGEGRDNDTSDQHPSSSPNSYAKLLLVIFERYRCVACRWPILICRNWAFSFVYTQQIYSNYISGSSCECSCNIGSCCICSTLKVLLVSFPFSKFISSPLAFCFSSGDFIHYVN